MKTPWVLACSKSTISFAEKAPRNVRYGFHASPLTAVMIGITPEGAVCWIEFAKGRKEKEILAAWKNQWRKTTFVADKSATAKAAEKILGKGGALKLQATGTKFQQSVWKVMLQIPAGEVLTYADVAKKIKNPKAVRAVGTACGANPLPIIVPCHRIIGSNGGLGGFGGGLPLKQKLLQAEGVKIKA